jgi:nucleotide-binding universal stress UspA family protein
MGAGMSSIVVGVDGSEGARVALRFALEEARVRGANVRAVAAWHVPALVYEGSFATPDTRLLDELAADTAQTLARAVEEAVEEGSDVVVETVVREGQSADVLLDEAADADLLVVGSRGLGGFRGLLLGSVGQQCAHHAPCPIVIVPHDRKLD